MIDPKSARSVPRRELHLPKAKHDARGPRERNGPPGGSAGQGLGAFKAMSSWLRCRQGHGNAVTAGPGVRINRV